ncbi:MAG: ATP-binding protein [Candidatus Margulisbacteria bacterium]|nr:ATP-binding protein [Candidatus Margulisiibacteriota bacterium]
MQKYQRLSNIALNRLFEHKESKIIALLGARQVGKTTLLMELTSRWPGKVIKYVGDKLEDAELWRGNFRDIVRELEANLGERFDNIEKPALLIFDEVQKIPEAFDNLKVLHDDFKKKIKIAVSGSSSLQLLHRTTESLGGRVEIVTMYPLSFTEILGRQPEPVWMEKSGKDFAFILDDIIKKSRVAEEASRALEKALVFGLFPEAYLQEKVDEVRLLYQNYHQTYIEKDVRDLKEVGNVLDFDLVWKIAHRASGQLINYTNISKETGLAHNTVKKYISILAASFNISIFQAYSRSLRRRVVRSPKLFSVDIGFFNHCLDIFNLERLAAAQLTGVSFESVMIAEFLKQERGFIRGGEPYFYRTSANAEVDLVVERGVDLYAYEFKYSERRPEPSDFNGIRSLLTAARDRLKAGFVVSRYPHAEKYADNLFAVPWWYFCS